MKPDVRVQHSPAALDRGAAGAVRTVVASGIRIYRESLADLLQDDPRLEIVARAADWANCVACIPAFAPDAVLLDLRLAPRLGAVRQLAASSPQVKVIALAVDGVDGVIECGEAGAAGYVTVEDSVADAVERILSALRGEVVAAPDVAARLLARVGELHEALPPRVDGLTRREREIAELLRAELSNKEIAARLHIEVATVKNHVHSILGKCGAGDRRDAAARIRNSQI
jgi:two-component system nitrate/nitrite response regulator NarL